MQTDSEQEYELLPDDVLRRKFRDMSIAAVVLWIALMWGLGIPQNAHGAAPESQVRYSCAPPISLTPTAGNLGPAMMTVFRYRKIGGVHVQLAFTVDSTNMLRLGVRSGISDPYERPRVVSMSDTMSLVRVRQGDGELSPYDRCMEGNKPNEVVGAGYSRQAYWWLRRSRHIYYLNYTVTVVTDKGTFSKPFLVKAPFTPVVGTKRAK